MRDRYISDYVKVYVMQDHQHIDMVKGSVLLDYDEMKCRATLHSQLGLLLIYK